jgi:hypothetical protein
MRRRKRKTGKMCWKREKTKSLAASHGPKLEMDSKIMDSRLKESLKTGSTREQNGSRI